DLFSPTHAFPHPLLEGNVHHRVFTPIQGSVVVGMSLDIASIDSISEINMAGQDYTATIFLRQRWVDERLCFDANKSLSLDGRLVQLLWVPDTFIVDSKRSFLHAVTVENRLIRIFPNGTVLYALRITATVACNMDLTKYPMDKQSCTLQLESWGYNTDDMVFYWTRGNDSVRGLENLRLAQYTVEEQFTSVSEAVYETDGWIERLIAISWLLRAEFFFFFTGGPPSFPTRHPSVSQFLRALLCPPPSRAGVTTVLTMTTLMMGARASLPNANCFIKAIDVYLGICFSFIFGALLEYAVAHFCTLHHRDAATPVSIRRIFCLCVCVSVSRTDADAERPARRSASSRAASARDAPPLPTDGSRPPPGVVSVPLRAVWPATHAASRRAGGICTVRNPQHIDNYSRTAFPLLFVLVNLLYWCYYL
uniref:Gamma-aminobutyric acid receptor subunit pi n=1 Tax=Petromyzon marinus TaxID=7757 RepID=S4RWU3_PETMA